MKADVLKTGKKMGKNRPKSSTDNAASTKSKSDFKGKKIHYKKKSELGKSAKKNVKKEPQEKQEKILSTNWKSFLKVSILHEQIKLSFYIFNLHLI